MKKISVLGIGYSFQALIISAWWIGIVHSNKFYSYFEFNSISKPLFQCFLVPDVVAISLLSLVICYKPLKELQFIVLGAFAYAAIFCLSVTIRFGGGEISSLVMLLGLFYNGFLCYQKQSFKKAQSENNTFNLLKTSLQTIFIWAIFLIVIPYFFLRAENKIPISISGDIGAILGYIGFILFSVFGVYTGYTLSKKGKGTPLPSDATTKLVVSGPYKYIRNPMAVAGVGQGLSIAIITKSLSIAIFFLLGAVVWHFVVRKIEENDMENKFGEEFIAYKKNVSCWLPTLKK